MDRQPIEMSRRGTKTNDKRFATYLEGLASVIGHAGRKAPLRDYCVGLIACQKLKQESRARTLRGTRLARLSSSRNDVHCSLRIPDLRAETIPPQALGAPGRSRSIAFPQITDLADLPLRTQRNIPNSIATMRRRLEHGLARTLSRCACSTIKFDHYIDHRL
ncbi:hypothetical protein JQ569_39545 [Bradyrhizobium elkanii]|nr:hypothetical protein [Bradyrhizobium elkanii]MBR1165233.1 hypothetical protein [Bradyrhizobium elkanii]